MIYAQFFHRSNTDRTQLYANRTRLVTIDNGMPLAEAMAYAAKECRSSGHVAYRLCIGEPFGMSRPISSLQRV